MYLQKKLKNKKKFDHCILHYGSINCTFTTDTG